MHIVYNVLHGFQKDWMKELSAVYGAWKQVEPAAGRLELESNGYVITQRSGLNIYTGLWVFSGCGLRQPQIDIYKNTDEMLSGFPGLSTFRI